MLGKARVLIILWPTEQFPKTNMPSMKPQLPFSNCTVCPPSTQSPPAGQLRQPGSIELKGPTNGLREYVPGLQKAHTPGRPAPLPATVSRVSEEPIGQTERFCDRCTCSVLVCIATAVVESEPATYRNSGHCSAARPSITEMSNVGLIAMENTARPAWKTENMVPRKETLRSLTVALPCKAV